MEKENCNTCAVGCLIGADARELMPLLIHGLAQYAAELTRRFGDAPEFDKRDDLRAMIGEMAAYWRLDNGSDEDAEREFLEPFDRLTDEAVDSGKPVKMNLQNMIGVLLALYCYANDMADTHGDDALDKIDKALDMMREIAEHWGIAEEKMDRVIEMTNARI